MLEYMEIFIVNLIIPAVIEYYGPFCSSKPELEQHHSGQDDSTIPGV